MLMDPLKYVPYIKDIIKVYLFEFVRGKMLCAHSTISLDVALIDHLFSVAEILLKY